MSDIFVILFVFALGVLAGGLAVQLWFRIGFSTPVVKPRFRTDYCVLLDNVPIYEGDDLHKAKRIRAAYRTKGRRGRLIPLP